jgi:hypothetical protein
MAVGQLSGLSLIAGVTAQPSGRTRLIHCEQSLRRIGASKGLCRR